MHRTVLRKFKSLISPDGNMPIKLEVSASFLPCRALSTDVIRFGVKTEESGDFFFMRKHLGKTPDMQC